MATDGDIEVEVVYALPHDQRIYAVRVPCGAALRQAVERSGILQDQPQLDLGTCAMGIYGRRADADTPLSPGDRIEIYRPLTADPKESRRRRAAKRAAR